jgi:hypothetical protein
LRSILRRDSGESYEEFLTTLAKALIVLCLASSARALTIAHTYFAPTSVRARYRYYRDPDRAEEGKQLRWKSRGRRR